MKDPNHCIAQRLKASRLDFGVSQKRLGILAGIDEFCASARMNQYEKGRHNLSLPMLQRISKVLGYPTAFFTSEDDLLAEIIYLIGKLSEADKCKILA